MPDLLSAIARRWKTLLLLTLAGTAVAYAASLLSPKLYLAQATALPANTALGDKARIFNANIEGLYSEWGSPDDLERIQGTAKLDTPYLAVAATCRLAAHYDLDSTKAGALTMAAVRLRKSSQVARSGYGELQVRVWDKDPAMAATLANALLQTLNEIHGRLQTENNRAVLQKLKEAYAQKRESQREFEAMIVQSVPGGERRLRDSFAGRPSTDTGDALFEQSLRAEEAKDYLRLISQYELALKTAPKPLLVVEGAKPAMQPDRPKTGRNVLLAFLASLLFSALLVLALESRKTAA